MKSSSSVPAGKPSGAGEGGPLPGGMSQLLPLSLGMLVRNIPIDMPIGIAVLHGPLLIVEFANNAYLQLVDKSSAEFVGQSIFVTLPELKGQQVEKLLNEVLRTGKPHYGSEFRTDLVRQGKRQSAYFNFVYAPIKDEEGVTVSIMVIANEVTGLVQGRHLLAESEREFRNMVMQSPIAMTIFRGSGFIIEMANTQMVKHIWRKNESDVIGKKALDIFPELKDQKYPALMNRVLTTGIPYRENEAPAYVQGDDGMKKFYLDFEYAPLYDTNGAVSGILITVNDVTERVQVRQKLEDAEARLRLATEGIGMATWDLDIKTEDLIYSPRLAEIFGHPTNSKLTFSALREQFHPEDLRTIVKPAFDKALQTTVYYYESRILWPDKSEHWIRTHGKVVNDSNGKPHRVLGTIQDITLEKKSSLNTALLAAIVQSSDDAIASKTLDGIVTSWNPGAEKLFGYTAEEMIGETILKVIPRDYIDEEHDIIGRIRRGEKIEHYKTVRQRKDGSLIDISLTISPLKDEKGTITGASKIARDITSQKRLDQALYESEQRLQIAVQAAQLGTWELNLKTRQAHYSGRYLEILGFDTMATPSHEELIQRIHPDDMPVREKAIANAMRTGVLDMQIRIVYPGNISRWIKARGKVFYDENNVPQTMLGTIMDITDQQKAFSALQESELLFKTIANVSPVGLWMTDKEGKNNFVNDTWIEWTGIPLEEQYNEGWLSNVLAEDKAAVTALFQQAAVAKNNFIGEFRLSRRDGGIRWCLTEGYPYYNNKGEFEGYAGSVTDITERKMVEVQLEQKVNKRTSELKLVNAALEKSNNELEQFAYVASHDLQEPLRKIKTFVGRLKELTDENSNPQGGVYMEKIVNAAARMSNLINDLLEYSRAAKETEQHTRTDLNEVLKNVLNDQELLIQQKNAEIKAGQLPVLDAIPHQMSQLFSNLIGNSLKFSKESTDPVITIRSRKLTRQEIIGHNLDRDLEYVEIIFSDNGIGFGNEFSERIFEIFQRLNPRHAYAGSGIGLSICRKIVTNHHGLIAAESSEGNGASFHIILPVQWYL